MPGNIILSSIPGVNLSYLGDAISETKNGAIITIEVSTGARQDIFPAGYNAWRKTVGCHVTARADEGRANRAVISIMAKTLDLRGSAITIKTGLRSEIKKVLVQDMNKPELISKIEHLI
jgi:uncharacterized protein (TIGR00251 family)